MEDLLESVKFFGRLITPSISENGQLVVDIVEEDTSVPIEINGENVFGTNTWKSNDVAEFIIKSATTQLKFYIVYDDTIREKKIIVDVSIRV